MADVLVVAVFDDEETAWGAVVRAAQFAAKQDAGVHDACLVVRKRDGRVHMRETNDISPTKAGWYGGSWGLLGGAMLGFPLTVAAASAVVGVFVARRRDFGVTDDFEQAVAERLEPGTAAAVVLLDDGLAPRIEAAARDKGAWTKTLALTDARVLTGAE